MTPRRVSLRSRRRTSAEVDGFETRGGLVEEERARLRQQFDRDARPLALTAREHPHRDVAPIGQVEVAHRLVDRSIGERGRCPRGQSELRRVLERAPQRHLTVDGVVLRDVADPRACGIDAEPVVLDPAG